MLNHARHVLAALVLLGSVFACGGDDGGGLTPAQQHGVGAACKADTDCVVGETALKCLPFKGGYCGLADCKGDADCPSGSACVAHTDGSNYCFLLCTDKPQCNFTRPPEIESNCVSNIDFVDGKKTNKACVPPG